MAKLVFQGKFANRVYEFKVEKTTVGRGEDNTLVVPDKSVSTHHCEILVNVPEVIIKDLNSTNGTYVDDLRVAGQSQVRAGQLIRFGTVEARLEMDLPTPLDTTTEITAIHGITNLMKEAQKRDAQKQAPHEKLTPRETASTAGTDHTFMMRKAAGAGTPQPAAAPAEAPSAASPPRRSRLWLYLVLGAIAVALGAVIYLLVWPRS